METLHEKEGCVKKCTVGAKTAEIWQKNVLLPKRVILSRINSASSERLISVDYLETLRTKDSF